MTQDQLFEVPEGHIASVITHLEMRAPQAFDAPDGTGWDLHRHTAPDLDAYEALFREIGRDYLWQGRLRLTRADWAALFADPAYHLYILEDAEGWAGLCELDFRQAGHCEIAYFGAVPRLLGQGVGRYMMRHAVDTAFGAGTSRLWLHTCTLDSPQALPFYRSCGFNPFKRQVDIIPDPRSVGVWDRSTAPHIPLL